MYISIHVMAEELEQLQKLKTTSEISQLYKQHPGKTYQKMIIFYLLII